MPSRLRQADSEATADTLNSCGNGTIFRPNRPNGTTPPASNRRDGRGIAEHALELADCSVDEAGFGERLLAAGRSSGMWDEFFHLRVDEIPQAYHLPHAVRDKVKEWFTTAEWFDVYNLIEYVLTNLNRFRESFDRIYDAESILNRLLEREMSGYRAIKMRLVPVTSPVEIAEINLAATPKAGFAGVAEHIDTALGLLGKKPEPDYRNSIKESISAVEAVAKLLTGEDSGGIDKAIAILERRGALHPSFKSALSKLYGYTSDKDGIRHPILEESTIDFAEAKFMLVACSAFVGFLTDSSR